MGSETVSVAIVDDDLSIRRSLGRLLSVHGYRIRTHASASALLDEVGQLTPGTVPGCIVSDMRMPGMSGLELQHELHERDIVCSFVFLTGYGDVRSSVEAMRGGAIDFLLKPFEQHQLLDAVGRGVERSVRLRALGGQLNEYERRLLSLTPRERQVFEHVIEGRLNKEIAAQMGITEKTVKVHRARVMRKMSVRSVAKLARIAERSRSAELHSVIHAP